MLLGAWSRLASVLSLVALVRGYNVELALVFAKVARH